MKIHFTRTGGVAGTKLDLEINTEKLPPGEARRLENLVSAASIFGRPPIPASAPSSPDRFTYRLSVEDGARKSEVEVGESSLPKDFEPLLDHLVEQARKMKGRSR